MRSYLKAFVLFMMLMLGVGVTAKQAKAYTPFYEMNAPTRRGSNEVTINSSVNVATGAFIYTKQLAMIANSGLPIVADIIYNTQDGSLGPFGPGTSCPQDWFVVRSVAWSGNPYVLVGPGNVHYVFDTLSNGVYSDTRDPTMLGATLSFTGQPAGVLCSLTFKDGLIYRFDTYGGLITQIDRYGNTINITRNSTNGFTSAVTYSNSAGTNTYRWVHYNQDSGNNHVIGVAIEWSYPYLVNGVKGTTKNFTIGYDVATPQGKISYIQTQKSQYVYIGTNYTWTSYTRSDGKVLPLLSTVTDANGHRSVYVQYDGATGRVTSTTNALGGVNTFSWSTGIGTDGVVTNVDSAGRSTTISYTWNPYKHGYKVTSSVDNTYGGTTTTAYEASPTYLVTKVTDFVGRVSRYTWNTTNGDLSSTSLPANDGVSIAATSMSYDPKYHILTSLTDPAGRTAYWEVDTNGNTTSHKDPNGDITKFTYDVFGNLATTVDPMSNTRTIKRDTNGYVIQYIDPAGKAAYITPYDTGLIWSYRDPNNVETDFGYNMEFNLTSILDYPTGAFGTSYPTTNTYDNVGNKLSTTDARGNVWNWTYDANNNVSTKINPLNKTRSWTWTLSNLLSKSTDFIGNSIEPSYSTGGRLSSVIFRKADQTIQSSLTYNYNSTTHTISSIVDSLAGTTTFNTRNVLDMPTSTTDSNGTVVTCQYDILNRLTQAQVSGQTAEVYHYNPKGLIDTLTQGSSITTFSYDPDGRLVTQTLPNGVSTTRQYNTTGQVATTAAKKSGVAFDNSSYQYDAAGYVSQSIINSVTKNYTNAFGGKATSMSDGTNNYTWTYNPAGYMNTSVLNGVTTNFTYNNSNDLTAFGGVFITRDDNGNPTAYNGRIYTWNVRGQLIGYTNGGNTFTFVYDALGNRKSMTKNGVTTYFTYDGDTLKTTTTNSVVTYVLDELNFGAPLLVGNSYPITTGDGSTTKVTDTNGNTVGTGSYTPLGGVTTTGTTTPFQFWGRYQPDSSITLTGGAIISNEWGMYLNTGGEPTRPVTPTTTVLPSNVSSGKELEASSNPWLLTPSLSPGINRQPAGLPLGDAGLPAIPTNKITTNIPSVTTMIVATSTYTAMSWGGVLQTAYNTIKNLFKPFLVPSISPNDSIPLPTAPVPHGHITYTGWPPFAVYGGNDLYNPNATSPTGIRLGPGTIGPTGSGTNPENYILKPPVYRADPPPQPAGGYPPGPGH